MTYPIWIGADKDGHCLIGAESVKRAVDSERIFPSQMAHRVTAKKGDIIMVMTPTEAKDSGFEIVEQFPRADGRLGRGH